MSDPADDERPFSALPKPEAEADAPQPEEPKRRRGLFDLSDGAFGIFLLSLLAAGCGGLIAVYWPWMTGMGSADNAALADRMSALETRIGQIATGRAPEAAAASFEALQRNIAALKDRADADEARLNAIEKTAGAEPGTDVGALKAAIDKNSSDIAQLSQQLDTLAQAPHSGAANPQLAGKIDANAKVLAGLRNDLDAHTKATGSALDALGGRIATLEQNAPPPDLAETLNGLASKSSVAALDARVRHLEDEDTSGLIRRAASVLALADLVRATAGDAPFANELKALRAVAPDAPEIDDLAHYADNGAPTMQTLTARFHNDIDGILAAERAAQAHNWAERLWADFVNLVSVRRVGNVAGNDTQARVARAEYALNHGDLAAAVREVDGLDAPAKKAASAWLKDAKARLAVARDARALTTRIVGALAAAKVSQPLKTDKADSPR